MLPEAWGDERGQEVSKIVLDLEEEYNNESSKAISLADSVLTKLAAEVDSDDIPDKGELSKYAAQIVNIIGNV